MREAQAEMPFAEKLDRAIRLTEGDESFKDNIAWPPRWNAIVLLQALRQAGEVQIKTQSALAAKESELASAKKAVEVYKMERDQAWSDGDGWSQKCKMVEAALIEERGKREELSDSIRESLAPLALNQERLDDAVEVVVSRLQSAEARVKELERALEMSATDREKVEHALNQSQAERIAALGEIEQAARAFADDLAEFNSWEKDPALGAKFLRLKAALNPQPEVNREKI